MERKSQLNYYNLPIIQPSEFESVDIWYDPTSPEMSQFEEFSQAIIKKYPLIKSVMSHDLDVWYLERRDAELIDDETLHDHLFGVGYGYIFVLGLYSKVNMLRNNVDNINDLIILGESQPGITPVINENSFNKIKDVRQNLELSEDDLHLRQMLGSAKFDELSKNDMPIADRHFDELLTYDKIFKDLYIQFGQNANMFLENHPFIDDSQVCIFMEGYRHGVKQAIEMYIQSGEAQALELISNY